MQTANAAVVVGVSGGADSVSLLLALCELKRRKKHDLRLVAGHFNHELRGADSDADAEFVRELTVKHGIEFATARAGKFHTEGNLEQNARRARYSFLLQTAENVNAFAVLTGHTVNDQAETFLLNLVRGSGVAGLSGMRAVRAFGEEFGRPASPGHSDNGEPIDTGIETPNSPLLPFSSVPLLVRPLLTWAKRIHTEGYCRDSGVEYRYDTMNEDTAFKRVRIRKILLPLLEDMNPNIVETLSNTAALMQQVVDRRPAEDQKAGAAELSVAELAALSEAEIFDILPTWLGKRRGTKRGLELKHVEAVVRLILSKGSGRVAELPGGRVVKSGGRLVYQENKVEN